MIGGTGLIRTAVVGELLGRQRDKLTLGLVGYDLAKRRKLRHVVYHSVFQVYKFHDVPHFAAKFAIESALRALDLP